ncbi:hypothetical protein N7540_005860 [Penicillium herquei]|nr:hypothetical protein N7540_005860 [Penicillium herquei]
MASISFCGNNSGLQVGDHHGSIHFHLPPERPETPPSPLSTVPFARDPDFVNRITLLNQIHEKSSVPGSRIALVGLGGAGKSQLAIEYTYRVRSESPATWVFWVHASNEARFEQSFRDIADQVKIPGRQDPKVNIYKLVENRLRDEKTGKWICILDNVDDDKFLHSFQATRKEESIRDPTNASRKPLLEYVPKGRNGSIIVTSRTREVALKLADCKDLVEVKPMESSEALELLQRKLHQARDSEESHKLVDTLELMPLAIVQAASYIQNRTPRYSVSQYLKDFQESDRKAIRLLKAEAGHYYRDWEAKNSILVTWQISFDYICQTKPSAAELLSLMSFFDRQEIPESLIQHRPKANDIAILDLPNDSDDTEESESDIGPDFEDDVMTLRNFVFISVSENGSFLTMHRLVQLTMQFPTGEYENWERCRALFPHVKCAISQRPGSPDCLRKWATLLYRAAWYTSQNGNITDTKDMAARSREERMILLGEEHQEVLDSIGMLAIAYSLDGRWKEAEQLQVQVMKTRKTKLGKDHPSTLGSMANLASTYGDQGRWEEAKQLQVQVMKTSKTKLGEDHPFTLSSMANLALTYRNQGRWEEAKQLQVQEEAEQLEVQVMKTSKTKLGEDHPNTLGSIANLALTYSNQGRWEEAEQLQVQVMKTSKTKLGEDHPDTLSSMANLALTYSNQGRWEEAKQLQVQVMKTSKTKLGEDHPDTLSSMANLALTYSNQGRWEEAEQLEVQIMKTRKTKLGEDHPDTLSSMANLAITWKSSAHDAEAINLLRECLTKQKQILGQNHPTTLSNSKTLLEWEMEVTQETEGDWETDEWETDRE